MEKYREFLFCFFLFTFTLINSISSSVGGQGNLIYYRVKNKTKKLKTWEKTELPQLLSKLLPTLRASLLLQTLSFLFTTLYQPWRLMTPSVSEAVLKASKVSRYIIFAKR